MQEAVIISFVAFLLVNLVVGLYQGRNVRTPLMYMLGNRSFSTGTLVLTMVATVVGAEYLNNWFFAASKIWLVNFILNIVSISGAALIFGFFVYPKLYEFKECHTLGDVVGKCYGRYAQLVVGIFSVIASVMFFSAQLGIAAHGLTHLLGFKSSQWIIVMVGITVIIYAVVGGMPAVTHTDKVQFALVLGGLMFIVYRMLHFTSGDVQVKGLASLWKEAVIKLDNASNVGTIQTDPSLLAIHQDWDALMKQSKMYSSGTMIRLMHNMLGFPLLLFSPWFTTRVFAARDKVQLKNSLIGFSLIYCLLMIMIFIGGLGLFTFYGHAINKKQIFSALINSVSHVVWMRVLLLFMLLLATLSTADSILHAGAVVIKQDIIKPLLGKRDAENMKWMQGIALSLGFLGLILAFFGSVGSVLIVKARFILGVLVIPIVGIVMGIQKNQKALLGGISCFVVLSLVAWFVGNVIDLSFVDPRWKTASFQPTMRYKLLFPYVMLLSVISYLFFEALIHKGLKWEKRARFSEEKVGVWQRLWLHTKSFFANPLIWAEEKIDDYESRPVMLALFSTLVFLIPPFLGSPVPEVYNGMMTILILAVLVISTLLLLHDRWYSFPKKYFALFWLSSVMFCLPIAFFLRYLYHPTLLNAFYLLLVPVSIHAFLSSHLAVVVSCLGYALSWFIYRFTFDASLIIEDTHTILTMAGLAFTTLWVWLVGGYHRELSLEKAKRPRIWASAWGHDLNHLFMEAQMETNESFNPLPKEKELQLEAYKKRLKSISKHLENATAQSQAFRQLILQDSIRSSEMVSMPLDEVVKHVYQTLPSDLREIVIIKGKIPMKVQVFLPMFTNILTNLLRNAWKVGAEKVELTWHEKEAVLYIKDNGPGISPDKLTRLFEMKPSRDGTGIGLPFIKEALYKMGALIDVQTSAVGSVFMILFQKSD